MGKTPCVATLHRVFKGLDVDAFQGVLREWVRDSGVDLGSVVSIDGKTLRGIHVRNCLGCTWCRPTPQRAGRC